MCPWRRSKGLMMEACSDCNCPVDPSANDVRPLCCRKGQEAPANLHPRADGQWNETVDGDSEKQNATHNKQKTEEEVTKTDQELDEACKEQQAAAINLETIRKTIKDLEEERRALPAKHEEDKAKKIAERQSQWIKELESNKKQSRTEVFWASRTLEELDKQSSKAAVVLVCSISMGHHFQVQPGNKGESYVTLPQCKCPCVTNDAISSLSLAWHEVAFVTAHKGI
eukprot:25737-Rhodomonas_salina.1